MELSEQYKDMWHYIEVQMSDCPLKDDLLKFKAEVAQLESSLADKEFKVTGALLLMGKEANRADALESSLVEAREERDAFMLMYQMSVRPVDVPHEEVVKTHNIVNEYLKKQADEKR